MIYRELTIVLVTGLLQMFDIFLGHPRTADEEYHAILALLAEKKISSSLDARGASLRNALFFALRSGLDSDKVLKDLVKLLIQSTGREYNNVTKNVLQRMVNSLDFPSVTALVRLRGGLAHGDNRTGESRTVVVGHYNAALTFAETAYQHLTQPHFYDLTVAPLPPLPAVPGNTFAALAPLVPHWQPFPAGPDLLFLSHTLLNDCWNNHLHNQSEGAGINVTRALTLSSVACAYSDFTRAISSALINLITRLGLPADSATRLSVTIRVIETLSVCNVPTKRISEVNTLLTFFSYVLVTPTRERVMGIVSAIFGLCATTNVLAYQEDRVMRQLDDVNWDLVARCTKDRGAVIHGDYDMAAPPAGHTSGIHLSSGARKFHRTMHQLAQQIRAALTVPAFNVKALNEDPTALVEVK